jgi:hypothetical protein
MSSEQAVIPKNRIFEPFFVGVILIKTALIWTVLLKRLQVEKFLKHFE